MQPRGALFDLISGRAAWLSQRQAVLTRNVANADTPGFQPQDVVPVEPAQLLRAGGGRTGALPLVRTVAEHVAPAGEASPSFREQGVKPFEVTPSGNGVVLAEQLEKMAATDLDYQLTTSLYRRYVGLFRTALGAPQG